MQGIIRLGDKTTHGGAVLSCSTTMLFGDIGVARKGDRVSCPEHGDATIVEGNLNYRERGFSMAVCLSDYCPMRR